MFDDDEYDKDPFPPVKYPGREATTMVLAAAMVGYVVWRLLGWLL